MLNKNIIKKLNNISNTNKVFEVKITSNNWLLESETGLYYKDVTHNLSTKYLFISAFNNTNDSVELAHKYIDDNTVRIYNDSTMDINLYILATTDVSLVQNQIDDNIVSGDKTWSSEKINNELKSISINVKDFNNSIHKAIDYIKNNNLRGEIYIPYDSYIINEPITIYTDIVTLRSNGAKLIANINEDEYLFKFTTKNDNDDILKSVSITNSYYLQGLEIVAHDLKYNKINCFDFQDVKAIGNTVCKNIIIKGFKTSINIFTNAYCLTFDKMDIWDGDIGVQMKGSGTNYGERITFTNSWFHSLNSAIEQSNGNGNMFFNNCSFDYLNGGLVSNVTDGRVFFNNCHIESVDFDEYWFIATNKGKIFFNNCEFLWAGNRTHDVSTQTKNMFYTDNSGLITITDCYMYIGKYYLRYLCGGNGNMIVNNLNFEDFNVTKFIHENHNLVANGKILNEKLCSHVWKKSSNVIIENDSIKIKRTIPGINEYVKLLIPIKHLSKLAISYKIRKQNAVTNSFVTYNIYNSDTELIKKYSESLILENSINFIEKSLYINDTNYPDTSYLMIEFNVGAHESTGECIWVTDIEINDFL